MVHARSHFLFASQAASSSRSLQLPACAPSGAGSAVEDEGGPPPVGGGHATSTAEDKGSPPPVGGVSATSAAVPVRRHASAQPMIASASFGGTARAAPAAKSPGNPPAANSRSHSGALPPWRRQTSARVSALTLLPAGPTAGMRMLPGP
eukprot:7091730-Heterocapsa_arctica.AAC.1